jgi:hypothetical protein
MKASFACAVCLTVCVLTDCVMAEFRLGKCAGTFPGHITNTITCGGVDWSGCGYCEGSAFIQLPQSSCDSSDETICEQFPQDLAYFYPNVNATGIWNGSCSPISVWGVRWILPRK